MSFQSFYLTESTAEKEVERLLKVILPDSPYNGLVHAVGGFVRDEYRSIIHNDPSIISDDLDIVVDLIDGANKVTHYIYNILGDKITEPYQLGKGYPIWQITFKDNIDYKGELYKTKGAKIEFADAMKEEYPDSNSRQRVTKSASLKDDNERRDFTVNCLMKDLSTGEFIDMSGQSKDDIKNGVLRGHPNVSFDKILNEDPLRCVRLVRFQAKYGWKVPLSVIKSVKRNAYRIETISNERISGEFKKIMEVGQMYRAIRLMDVTGLLHYILPEIEDLKGVQQNPEHHTEGDAFVHTLMVLKNAKAGVLNQLAALLHDIGKAKVTQEKNGKIISHGHEDVGATMAEHIMKRLKISTLKDVEPNVINKVILLIKNHMRPHALNKSASSKAIRKFVRDMGSMEMVNAVLDLASADEQGKIPSTDEVSELRKKIADTIKDDPTPDKRSPILNGKEIMDLLNIGQGSEVGRASKLLSDIEDEYGSELTKEKAKEELIKKF